MPCQSITHVSYYLQMESLVLLGDPYIGAPTLELGTS